MQVEFQRGWRLSEKVLESISFRVPRIKVNFNTKIFKMFFRKIYFNAIYFQMLW